MALGQSGHLDPRGDDSEDEEYRGIPEHENNINNSHGVGLEDQVENPLIHLTPSQREAAIENLDIESKSSYAFFGQCFSASNSSIDCWLFIYIH
jgi:hypothetical protein